MMDLREIVARLGGQVYAGGTRANVPGPGHSKHDLSLSLWQPEPGGRIVVKSFADDPFGKCADYLGIKNARPETPADRAAWERRKRERDREAARERAAKLAWCGDVWSATVPAEGSPVETYLRTRALPFPIPPVIRFGAAVPVGYGLERTAPAMVACVMGPNREPVGLHVTWLKPDGSGKARSGPNSRIMFGSVAGHSVQLAKPTDAGELAVAEGIETALSFSVLNGTPCWAALSTAGLQTFSPPPSVRRLIVAADSDDTGAGLEAARALAERARKRCDVLIVPAPEGQDWNDVQKEARQ